MRFVFRVDTVLMVRLLSFGVISIRKDLSRGMWCLGMLFILAAVLGLKKKKKNIKIYARAPLPFLFRHTTLRQFLFEFGTGCAKGNACTGNAFAPSQPAELKEPPTAPHFLKRSGLKEERESGCSRNFSVSREDISAGRQALTHVRCTNCPWRALGVRAELILLAHCSPR